MFKLYPNKSSVLQRDTRYVSGGTSEVAPLKVKWWERTILEKEEFSDRVFVINNQYKFKPKMISFLFFERDDLDWLILQYNNIVDIIEELDVGKTIIIPSKARALRSLIINQRPSDAAITAEANPDKITR